MLISLFTLGPCLTSLPNMENWDDDFSTLKGPPKSRRAPLSMYKADVPLDEGDATITKQQIHATLPRYDLDDDDDFADDFEAAAKFRTPSKKPAVYSEALDLSDSGSAKSPERASSISSAISSLSSAATSWDANDDVNDSDFFEFGDANFDLRKRMAERTERAKIEAAKEQQQLASQVKTLKAKKSYRKVEFDDELLDLGLDKLPAKAKTGTINKNVKFGLPPQQPPQPSKMLRGMRSIAQMPNQRDSPQKLRQAVSMMDLGKSYALETLRPHQLLPPATTPQRPLTSYKEPSSTHKRHRKRPNLIQYPSQAIQTQKCNGMVLNTSTGMWEGNDIDDSRFDFDTATVKPKLITKQSFRAPEVPSNGMLFDNRTLSWVYANEAEYDDPFASIDEPQVPFAGLSPLRTSFSRQQLRKFTNDSAMSSTSSLVGRGSVARSESSGTEVFHVSARQASEWRHIDERFMRKFGKWIGGDKEHADSLQSDQQFYDMVRNA